MCKPLIRCSVAYFALVAGLSAEQPEQDIIKQLMQRLAVSEQRIQALEQKLGVSSAVPVSAVAISAPSVSVSEAKELSGTLAPMAVTAVDTDAAITAAQVLVEAHDQEMAGHNMQIPGGGPKLNIRGFFDFNFGAGSIANPLIFPIATNGCQTCGNPQTPAHSTFQAGEFDLFMTSKLSEHMSFIGEVVFGADTTNEFSIDIERYQLTYRQNDYFSISAGRFHTAIGYYNTAYHHGNWFSTAEGRPIMFLFEDSGGVLPVHTVGLTMTGRVPATGNLGLHWVVEAGNGRSSNRAAIEPVQNFYSDRNYKAVNVAVYVQPQWIQGLQIGASFYHDRLAPQGVAGVDQNIPSAYAVYHSPNWEFMNEAVLLSNHLSGTAVNYRSPMAYTQVSRAFGIYRPYFRYQYVNDRLGDPVNVLQGLYYGPSAGIRIDYSEYAAFKLQYNRLLKGTFPAANGVNAQIAFTF